MIDTTPNLIIIGAICAVRLIASIRLLIIGAHNCCRPFLVFRIARRTSNALLISIGANNLVLWADHLPLQPGIFIAGPLQARIPFFNGFLCIEPSALQRLKPVLVPNPATRMVHLNVDLSTQAQTPFGCGPVNVVPGLKYNFQYWTRDPAAGGALANFSTAICICFSP